MVGLKKISKRIYIIAFLVALITILVYLPALQNDFVNWDDQDYVYENPHIWSLDFEFFKWMFTTFHASNWHPLTWFSHAIDYAIWGLNPMGHHLTSIIFHGLNTFLVVLVITRLVPFVRRDVPAQIRNQLIAGAVTGLLFGLHPLHVESVAWVSERKDVLYAFFFLLSLLAYLKYTSSLHPFDKLRARGIYYSLCLLFFTMALMSKPMAVTLPVVLIILDIYPLGRLDIRSAFSNPPIPPLLKGGQEGIKVLIEKLPFFALSIASSVITVMAQQAGGAMVHFKSQLLGDRILIAFRALGFYLLKMFWPTELYPLYPYPSKISFLTLQYIGAFILVVCITAFCIWSWKRQKLFSAIWAYYIVTLLPVLGIIQVGSQSAADRYTYLPSLSIFLLIGLGITFIYERVMSRRGTRDGARKRVKTFIFISSILIVCLLSILTIQQTMIWKDSLILWNTEISKFPNVHIAYRNLGEAYGRKGNYQESIENLNRAIALNPVDSVSYGNRGIAYGKSGLHRKAIEDFNRAIKLNPQNAKFYNNLGVAYGNSGDYQQAIENLDMAIKLDSLFTKAYYHRGIAYKNLGFNQYAIRDFQTAARLGNKNARYYLKAKGIGW